MSQLLMQEIGRPELEDFFAELEMSSSRYGKISFASSFVKILGEIWHQLVHRLESVKGTLGMEPGRRVRQR